MKKTIIFIILILSAFSCFAAEEGLVAHWRFDKEGDIEDLSGNGYTAAVSGGRVVTDSGKKVLECDGAQSIQIASAKDLCVRKKFAIELSVKFPEATEGMNLISKENEFLLRTDWNQEGGKISFFVFGNGGWEPRVSAFNPQANTWYHMIIMWDGTQSYLWVNGEVFTTARSGAVKPTDDPLVICSRSNFGGPFAGCVEYVKVYKRMLTAGEIVRKQYGIDEKTGGGTENTVFDFSKGLQGWVGREGAELKAESSKLKVNTKQEQSFIINKDLNANIDRRDYLAVRMAVDKGSRGDIIFATTKGASRVSFQTYADNKMHAYVFEPWAWNGWGGNLIALGIGPSEVGGTAAQIEYVKVMESPDADPEIQITGLFIESVLPRAEKTETLIVRVKNAGGPVSGLQAVLKTPEGVTVKGSAVAQIPALKYLEEKEISWQVESLRPVSGDFVVEVTGKGVSASKAQKISFLPNPKLPKASYVPEPKPVKPGKYQLWTHYCPLWKHGTHMGWKLIEPWPERKPVIGYYNEGTPEVADWHIKYWLEHGISAVIYCWYRTTINGPVQQQLGHAIHDGLLKARYLNMIKFSIMWENGCGAGAGSSKDVMDNLMPFWIDNYFSNPSYLRVDNKPILYIWVPQNVTRDAGGSPNVRTLLNDMREACKARGLNGLYIVGCVSGKDAAELKKMADEGWDASSSYGSSWWYPKEIKKSGDFICAPYEGFVDQQEEILKFKNEVNAQPDITSIMMGWDSRPWKETPFFWCENTAEKFRDLCVRAKKITDSKTTSGPEKNTMIFCCWNEFGEGHYIEPTRGYGFSYLDVIRDVFTEAPKEHMDISPEDVGLGPYDSWYQDAKKLAPITSISEDTEWSGARMGVWTGMMGLKDVEVKDGILTAMTSSTDPAFSSPALKIRANRYTRVVMDMRVSKGSSMQLFFMTSGATNYTEPASSVAQTKADGEFHEYSFNVGRNENWGGCLTGMRFDSSSAEGALLEIRSIRLE